MTPLLALAIACMLSALALYTVAVWSEQVAGVLRPWHVSLFWLGLVFDTTGTTIMGEIAGRWLWNLHVVTGALAIALMLVHAVWATVALARGRERTLANFHKFSVHVWVVWLIPFLSGVLQVMVQG